METIYIDPNQFHLDFQKLGEVLVTIIVFGFFINRVAAILLEARVLVAWVEKNYNKSASDPSSSFKEYISDWTRRLARLLSNSREVIVLALSIYLCFHWQLDAFTILLSNSETIKLEGTIITGGIVAGVSKLFDVFLRDFIGVNESSVDDPWHSGLN